MPPKSQSTTSPCAITRSLGSWCGLARVGARRRRWRSSAARDRARACARRARGARRARCGPRTDGRASRRRSSSTAVRGGAQRVDLGRVLHDAQRSGDVGGAAERDVGQRVLEVEHEAGPRVVADRGASTRADRRARRRSRSGPRSPPTARSANASGCSTTRGASSRGHHEHRVAVGGQHEHREPLERHRLVAGEVRQVGAGRQQQDVDAELAHPRPRPRRAASDVHRLDGVTEHQADESLRRRLGVVAGADERARLRRGRSRGPRRRRRARRTRRASTSARPAGAGADGRRYWPRVRMSTPTLRRSAIAPRTSSAVSPMPRMMPDFVTQPGVLGPGQQRERAGVAGRRAGRRAGAAPPSRGCGSARRAGRRRSRRARRRRPCSRGSAPRPWSSGCAARTACDRGREAGGAAVGDVVAGHARDHRVLEPERARPRRRPGAARRGRAGAACGCRRGRSRTPGCSGRRGS